MFLFLTYSFYVLWLIKKLYSSTYLSCNLKNSQISCARYDSEELHLTNQTVSSFSSLLSLSSHEFKSSWKWDTKKYWFINGKVCYKKANLSSFCVVWHKTVVFRYRIFANFWSNLIILSWVQVPGTSARLREHEEIYGSASRDCLHRTAIYCSFSSHVLSSTPMAGLSAVFLVGSVGELWEIKTTF